MMCNVNLNDDSFSRLIKMFHNLRQDFYIRRNFFKNLNAKIIIIIIIGIFFMLLNLIMVEEC